MKPFSKKTNQELIHELKEMKTKQVVEIIDRLHEFRLLFVKESDQVKRINETIYTLIELFIPFSMRADFLSKYL